MKFSEYMNDWLYGEQGYYSDYHTIGKEGDFYTAVSSSKFFGGTIAKYMIQRINEGHVAKSATLCEIGAHHGYLMADMIEFIYTLQPELLTTLNFVVIERFSHLREKQAAYFKEAFGDEVKIDIYESLDELRVGDAFFVANEIFDAFGCDLIKDGKTATVSDDVISFNAEDAEVLSIAKRYGQTGGEIGRGYEAFALEMANAAKRSEFITFDYGDITIRNDFSSRIYRKHEVFPLFDEEITLADVYATTDITYDVNFLHVKDAYEEASFTQVAYGTQLKAMIDFGLLELLEILQKNVSDETYLKEVGKVKTIIDPTIMGERFKMIHLKKA
jgi:SAM-dependent MidA family methyltransferase